MSQTCTVTPSAEFQLQDRNDDSALVNFEPAAHSTQDAVMAMSLVADAEVPDGGYGWVIAAAGAACAWWSVGLPYTWGVMQAALVSQKGYSASTLAFVGSLQPSCIAILGIVNARIIQRIGARLTVMAGIFLLGFGSLLSSLSVSSVAGLFITWGVVGGIGMSLIFITISVVPAQYFKSKRGIANGIVYAGGGLGGTVMSFIITALLGKLSIAWTFRILGFMCLGIGLPAAYLIKERTSISRSLLVEWKLFKNLRFNLVFITGLIGTFPLLVPPFFLPLYGNSLGLSPSLIAGLVAGFNFSSMIGRLACGLSCDRLGSLNTLCLSLFLSALSLFVIWPLSSSIGPLIVFVIINGMANGGFFSTMPTVVGNVFGSARVSVAMGMIVSGWLGGYMMGAPIAGWILEASGGDSSGIKAYHPAIFYAASIASIATILAASVRLNIDRNLKKNV